jgi:hypothetical protein
MQYKEEYALRNEIIDEARKGMIILCYDVLMDVEFFAITVPAEDIISYTLNDDEGYIEVSTVSQLVAATVDMDKIAEELSDEE